MFNPFRRRADTTSLNRTAVM